MNKKTMFIIMGIIVLGLVGYSSSESSNTSGDTKPKENIEIEENVQIDENIDNEVVEYIIGGNHTDYSKLISTNSDTYGVQEDTVYVIPVGKYKVEFMSSESVGKFGLLEVENDTLIGIVEDGEYYENFEVRETIEISSTVNKAESSEIIINEGEQIDVNGNVIVKLTEIK